MDLNFPPEWVAAFAGAALVTLGLLLLWRARSRRRKAQPGATDRPPPSGRWLESLRRLLGGAGDEDERLLAFEAMLLSSDVGVRVTEQLIERLRAGLRAGSSEAELVESLRRDLLEFIGSAPDHAMAAAPHVILVAGVNGVGKTTSIAKLAHLYQRQGRKVLLVAADTFRAAAAQQLEHWAERVGVECVGVGSSGNPAAVVFDGLQAAKARGVDIVIVDTAGRLHVKAHLIEELKKMLRVMHEIVPGAPHERLLVLDATTGQNAVSQARVFVEAIQPTGVILTKMDGTAKGGCAIAVRQETGLPVRYVGYGESMEALAEFDPEDYVASLIGPRRAD